ncbi:replicative DNA helicase [Solilutibacter silvestris]|uniref:replicative DNA helicase n=1 Tax=Solilutibacter silvestris TaxID=1645665 RepID=UPI003D34A7D0
MADGRTEHLRIPPQSVEAEQSVIGGVMLVPERLDDVREILRVEDFYRRDHQTIYRAICELSEKDKPFDAVTLGEWFERHGMGELVAGGAYLIELASNTPSAANIVAYSEIVRDKAVLRQVIAAASETIDAAWQPGPFTSGMQIAAEGQIRLAAIEAPEKGGPVLASTKLGELIDDMEESRSRGTTLTGLPTPWNEVNERTGGLQDGELIIVAGRPSMGKSVVGLQIAMMNALRGKRVGFFSVEMSMKQCNQRMLACLGEVPHGWVRTPVDGPDSDEYWTKVTMAMGQLKNMPLYIDETAGIHRTIFRSRARKLHRKHKLDLLVLDHLHDMEVNPEHKVHEYGQNAQMGKALGKELGIPVVMLAQLNRALSTRADKRPVMSDLRESGEIEQKADLIIFVHREDYYDTPKHKTHLQGVVELSIGKGRDIRSGGDPILLKNRYDQMRLEDWTDDYPSLDSPISTTSRSPGGFRGRSRKDLAAGDRE